MKRENKQQIDKKKRIEKQSFWNRVKEKMTVGRIAILTILTILSASGSMYQAITEKLPFFAGIIIYVCAAICLTLCTICYICKFRYVKNEVVTPYIKKHRMLNKLVVDVRLRVVLTTLPGMGINLIFTLFNGAVALLAKSAWYGSLAAYYLLLCIMRFLAVSYAKKLYFKKLAEESLTF